MESTKIKRKYNLSFLMMLFCISSFTIGQYIPIYFRDTGIRGLFYFIILILLVGSVSTFIFKRVYKPQLNNLSSSRLYSILGGLGTFIVFGFWSIGLLFSGWSEAFTYYVRKDNPKIKIISRYINQGAFGGGTEKDDYQVVLTRPILEVFKMETAIDTTDIKKEEWRKPETYNLSDIKGKWYVHQGTTPHENLIFQDKIVSVQNRDTPYKLNYLISYDTLYMWDDKSNFKTKNKILDLTKDEFTVEDKNEARGVRNYSRQRE